MSHALTAMNGRSRLHEPVQPEVSEIQGCRFLDIGDGPVTVVLLHGLFGTPENWRSIMNDLGEHYRFLALQLPIDHNGKREYNAFRSLGQLTDHVETFIDAMGLRKTVLCGNSLGGQVALDFYLRRPECVDRLIITGSAGLFEQSLSGGRAPQLCRGMIREQACEIFYDPMHVTEKLVDEIYGMLSDRGYRRFLLRVAKATRDRSMKEDLAKVSVPTWIIWGRNDTITPPFVAEQFCSGIRNARLNYIDECGHAPPIEQPKEFARLLHHFLAEPAVACVQAS
ncbi:MAG: alpha/beta fold hydrolase [Patescibacteria group bacterium]|nr:alpha/beta fold hydrolase [Patescibacteria group bacterium]